MMERREGDTHPVPCGDSAPQAGESAPAACPVLEAGFQPENVARLAALTCPTFLPGILCRSFREPARFPDRVPVARSWGGSLQAASGSPIRSDELSPGTVYLAKNPFCSSGIQPAARCMCLPALISCCSPENADSASKCRILWLFLERTRALGGLKCAVLTRNLAKIDGKIVRFSRQMLFQLPREESRRGVDRVLVQEEEARPLLVAGSGLVTHGGKEYLHSPNSSFVSLSG